jgi:hypothetical protein
METPPKTPPKTLLKIPSKTLLKTPLKSPPKSPPQSPSKRNSHRRSRARRIPVNVGEDITAPALLASQRRIPIRTERAAAVARWFGLGRRRAADGGAGDNAAATADASRDAAIPLIVPAPGTILLITGPSGAGKSTLYRSLRAQVEASPTPSDAPFNCVAVGPQAHMAISPAPISRVPRSQDAVPTADGINDDQRPWLDLAAMSAPTANLPLVDCFGGDATPLRDVLLLLARVGLGEAWTYLRTPEELSEGQKWRFKLALALHAATSIPIVRSDTVSDGAHKETRQGEAAMGMRKEAPVAGDAASGAAALRVDLPFPAGGPILACDEFAAVLDRVTAMVVARCLRRAIDANPQLAGVVATSHDDLQPALRPDIIAYCDFGRVEWRRVR